MPDTAKQAEPRSTPRAIYLKDYRPPAYLVDDTQLVFDVGAQTTEVVSRLKIRRNPEAADAQPHLVLDGDGLELVAVALDERVLDSEAYAAEPDRLVVYDVPEQFELTVETRIHPADNTALEGLYASNGMLCTQCEAQGFRRITYFPDRPDVMSRYEVTLIADRQRYPVLLSNGNPVDEGEYGDGRHWVRWQDPSRKPSYLFALVAGDLQYIEDSYTTMSGREVTLRLYTEAANIHKTGHAMASLKQAMAWDEQTYGREYDLDIYMIVAVDHFNMGAMENKGLNIFNSSCVLASAETATDNDFYRIQSIIGHEYFHNWSGNRVTCRDWFQLSLKEGFTVFRDQEFSSDLNSRAVQRIDDVNILRTHQFAEDAGPMAHPVRPDHYIEISNFYTVTVYNKGAEVVRMIRNLLGAQGFRKGTDLYFERHDGQAVTTDDFVRAMEDANGVDLTQFRRWYEQAGTPILRVSEEYHTDTRSYTLHIEQDCPPTPGQGEKQPFHIPLAMGLLDGEGEDMPTQLAEEETAVQGTRVLELKEPRHSFTFINVPERPTASLLRGFSAPVKIDMARDERTLAFLLANDQDEFNRWDAGQSLAMQHMLALVEDVQAGRPLVLSDTFVEAMRRALTDPRIDKALLARILTLPSEAYLADQMDTVDVEAIHLARLFVRRRLAELLEPALWEVYEDNRQEGPYRFTADSMARRALHNACLGYLMELQSETARRRCLAQFEQANNMSDQLSALSILAQHDVPERQQALDAFYARWQQDPLVVEKWLAVQAGSRLPDTLDRVRQLLGHPAFSMHNPNKVRALIGRFAHGNPLHFHAADGSGYAFVGEQVRVLDSMNPQIAARLVQAFSRWRRYDEARQGLMREQLEALKHKEDISKDVYEVVTRSLGEAE